MMRRKLEKGEIPHRDALIEFSLGMTLNMKKENVNQLLSKSGYEPLQARNLYEGLLLTIYRYEEKADTKEIEEIGDYDSFQVFVSEKVDEAMEMLPEVKNLLRETPQWYLNKQDRFELLEKTTFSNMIYQISVKMTNTWKDINRNKLEKVSESTFRRAAADLILELQEKYLDKKTYMTVHEIILRTERKWVEAVNAGVLLGMDRKSYLVFFEDILEELDSYYRNTYALKKKRSSNKGKSGGRKDSNKKGDNKNDDER